MATFPAAAKRQFDEFGYVHLPDFFGRARVEAIRAEMSRYQRHVAPRLAPREWIRVPGSTEGGYVVLDRIDFHDPYFGDLARDRAVAALAAFLLGEPVRGQPLQFFNVLPGARHHTPPHQDAFIYKTARSASLNVWLPLCDVDESKGCLRYVPQSHKAGRRVHGRRDGKGPFVVTPFTAADEAAEAAVPVRAGDVLVHHGLTIHRSSKNTTAEERWAVGFPFLAAADGVRLTTEEWLRSATSP